MFNQKDLVHAKNLQRLMAKAKIELEGQEILAAADVLLWVGQLAKKIEEDLNMKAIAAKATTADTGPQAPESLPEEPKKSKRKG